MNKTIKLISILLVLTTALTLASCGAAKDVKDQKLKVLGSVFPQYDFARTIGGDDAECEMLLRPGADSHSYTGDSPSDILRISNCDLFIYVGGETDSEWVDKIREKLESEGGRCPVFLSLCDVCDTVDEEDYGIIEAEAEEDAADEGEYDEHVWTSPLNAISASNAICEEMCRLDEASSSRYRERCGEYVEKLRALDSEYREATANAKSNLLVFADRFPFRYLAKEYGLSCFAAFNGCASQSEPAPTTILDLCTIVEENSLPYVCYIETSNSRVPDLICKNTGCGKVLLHSCHTVSERDLDDGATYLALMKANLENLKKVLNYD
ncbi:MAG: zinc ABC transporter substrate-binding protein [Clostridia bacterium]|nr:zinc ABC transporter substrate-binding protein [Clostridia bacterium]